MRQGDAPAGRSVQVDPLTRDRVLAVVAAHRNDRGPLLPVLHGIAAEFGYVDEAVIPLVAEELNLSRADVHGVVSFYRDFRREPAGSTVVRVCRAEACQSMGARELVRAVTGHFAVELGGTSPDRRVTVDQVFCLGNCALAPAAEVDGAMIGRASLDRILERVTARQAAQQAAQQEAQQEHGGQEQP